MGSFMKGDVVPGGHGMVLRELAFKEVVEGLMRTNITPLIVKCHGNQDWRILFNKILLDKQPVVIDALNISLSELTGINYRNRTKYIPAWFNELKQKKVLVIENLDNITPKDEQLTDDLDFSEYGEVLPGQISFLFLCRNSNEEGAYRSLNEAYSKPDSQWIIPTDVITFIIMNDNPKYRIIDPILSRCAFLDMNDIEKDSK